MWNQTYMLIDLQILIIFLLPQISILKFCIFQICGDARK